MNISLHPDADEEFAGAVAYYSAISPELGVRFYREIKRLLLEVAADPQRFRKFDPPARRHFSNDFPYTVTFVDNPEYVRVIAVMHMHREPGYRHERIV